MEPQQGFLSPNRLHNFTDGVFAVAITLLVFELTVPQLLSGKTLWNELWSIWPKFLTFFITAVIIGIFWAGHYIMFRFIKGINRTLILLNTLLLIMISTVPFAAGLLGTHTNDALAVGIYGGVLGLASLMFAIIWLYASEQRRLVHESLPEDIVELGRSTVLLPPVLYAIAIICAFYDPFFSKVMYVLIIIGYILPFGPIDKLVNYRLPEEH